MDPITLMMFALIAVMIFFMFRNSKKRKAAMEEMQTNMRPGAEVMLQSGIFATLEEIDEETNRATVRSGNSTLIVHRNAISQVVTPLADSADASQSSDIAPDDDPAFGERLASGESAAQADAAAAETTEAAAEEPTSADSTENPGEEQTPKA
ncbi:preprotein translocase subunit YajC [Leucobacter exalbidus]|uniref:Preprotein translocase subunit YajC n=1 Tax=Leucobacter exalbidus TaxID=662960 RepID=A0A940SZP6_9MICO|nr:preprotein translocase subunit YajC [Leucobacter exalbidus]MBP1325110.1 preprotein translocase subunit YajC [Leucobacter exalbidus]